MKPSLKNKLLNYIAMAFIFSPCLLPLYGIKWLVSDMEVKWKIIGLIFLIIIVPIAIASFGVLFMCFFATCFFFKDVFDWTFHHKLNSSQDRDKWLSETFSDVHKFLNKSVIGSESQRRHMWKCEKSEVKTKRSGWKTAVYLYWIAALLIISLAGAVGKEFGDRLFKPRIVSNVSINTESLNWQRRSSGIWGISLESPVELNEKVMRIPQQAMQYIKDTKSYVGTVGDFHINVTVSHYVDTVQADLEGAAKGSIAGLKQTVTKKGGTGFSYDTQRTYVSGNEAILVTTEYASPSMNGKVKSRSVIFMDFPKLWMVQTTFMDNPNNAIMAERIIGSIEKE